MQVKPGYWDQNVRSPGSFLPRNGGSHYRDAWAQVGADIDRVYVESWNEYDEGTGTYSGSIGEPYILPGSQNSNTDVWSADNDPNEYINTTATYSRLWNNRPDLDSMVLNYTIPTSINTGERISATVVMRNQGDESWRGDLGFRFGQRPEDDAIFMSDQIVIDDASNEIPLYGGIFRGRPITFTLQLTAPSEAGFYETHWQMMKGEESFGEVLTLPIEVK